MSAPTHPRCAPIILLNCPLYRCVLTLVCPTDDAGTKTESTKVLFNKMPGGEPTGHTGGAQVPLVFMIAACHLNGRNNKGGFEINVEFAADWCPGSRGAGTCLFQPHGGALAWF